MRQALRQFRSLAFRLNRSLRRPISNRKGVALIMAVSALVILTYLAMEVSYDSNVEYTVNAQALNRIKAYYAAKSAVQLGLLRVKIYQQLMSSPAGSQLGSLADQIWKMKLAWPIPIPEGMNAVDRGTLTKSKSESIMDASWDLDIVDEGSKIDLNDLVSPSKKMREITREQISNIFKQASENDEDWRKKLNDIRPEEIVNNLTDWQSDKWQGVGGGDKRSAFAKLGPGYPPNRAFRTLAEVRLVPGISEEIYDLLLPRITIYGMKAINPNSADTKVLQSLDPSFNDKIVKDLDEFRKGDRGPFTGTDDAKCSEAFWAKATEFGARPAENAKNIPMTCKSLSTFRITASGIFGEGKNVIRRDIEAIVMNLSQSANRVKKLVEEEKKAATGAATAGATGTTAGTTTGTTAGATAGTTGGTTTAATTGSPSGSSNNSNEPLPKGPPRIVYWREQ